MFSVQGSFCDPILSDYFYNSHQLFMRQQLRFLYLTCDSISNMQALLFIIYIYISLNLYSGHNNCLTLAFNLNVERSSCDIKLN